MISIDHSFCFFDTIKKTLTDKKWNFSLLLLFVSLLFVLFSFCCKHKNSGEIKNVNFDNQNLIEALERNDESELSCMLKNGADPNFVYNGYHVLY